MQTTPGALARRTRDGRGGQCDHPEHVGLEEPSPVVHVGVLDRQVVDVDAGVVDQDPQVAGELEGRGIGHVEAAHLE